MATLSVCTCTSKNRLYFCTHIQEEEFDEPFIPGNVKIIHIHVHIHTVLHMIQLIHHVLVMVALLLFYLGYSLWKLHRMLGVL